MGIKPDPFWVGHVQGNALQLCYLAYPIDFFQLIHSDITFGLAQGKQMQLGWDLYWLCVSQVPYVPLYLSDL